jgi:hypothetical protein
MNTSDFWNNVLEPDEKLLWTGRPQPRLHWRNWRLYGSAPMAAAGLFVAAAIILAARGTGNDIWLLILPAFLVLIPARATYKQLGVYEATRYALTDKRVLFFRIEGQKTRAKAIPRSAMTTPKQYSTVPPSVSFLRQDPEKKSAFGFDYIKDAAGLLPHLEAAQ